MVARARGCIGARDLYTGHIAAAPRKLAHARGGGYVGGADSEKPQGSEDSALRFSSTFDLESGAKTAALQKRAQHSFAYRSG
jgi:hypothetical protein